MSRHEPQLFPIIQNLDSWISAELSRISREARVRYCVVSVTVHFPATGSILHVEHDEYAVYLIDRDGSFMEDPSRRVQGVRAKSLAELQVARSSFKAALKLLAGSELYVEENIETQLGIAA